MEGDTTAGAIAGIQVSSTSRSTIGGEGTATGQGTGSDPDTATGATAQVRAAASVTIDRHRTTEGSDTGDDQL